MKKDRNLKVKKNTEAFLCFRSFIPIYFIAFDRLSRVTFKLNKIAFSGVS